MKLSAIKLLERVKPWDLPQALLVEDPQGFVSRKVVEYACAQYPGAFAVRLENPEPVELLTEVQETSLFASTKVVAVDSLQRTPKASEVQKVLEHLGNHVVVWRTGKTSVASSRALVVATAAVSRKKMPDVVQRIAYLQGYIIEDSAVDEILEYTSDLDIINSEIAKYGKVSQHIAKKEVRTLKASQPTPRTLDFETAVLSRVESAIAKAAVKMLCALEPTQLNALALKVVGDTLVVKSRKNGGYKPKEIARESSVPYYLVLAAFSAEHRFSALDLVRAYIKLGDLDSSVRRGLPVEEYIFRLVKVFA